MEASLEVHLVWACPAQIVVVSALLVLFLGGDGGAVAAGVACLVAVLPLAKVLVRWMIRVRKRRMPVTDARVREVGEVLGGIRVSKLNGWEPLWDKRWKALRAVELGYTRLEMFVYGLSMLLMVTSPVVATIALFSATRPSPKPRRVAPAVETTTPAVRRRERSFESVERTIFRVRRADDRGPVPQLVLRVCRDGDRGSAPQHHERPSRRRAAPQNIAAQVHMLTSADNYLSPADAFTVLALIGALRFPINKLGTLLGQLAQALKAFERIETFVGAAAGDAEKDEEEAKRADEPTGDRRLVVERGAFRYAEGADGADGFAACRQKRLELSLGAGDLCVLVGPVGSGKTTIVGHTAWKFSSRCPLLRHCHVRQRALPAIQRRKNY